MINKLFDQLILNPERYNFYQFCSILEYLHINLNVPSSYESDLSLQFCSWPYLGFPAGELKKALPENIYNYKSETVFTTFLGLIGSDGVMPNWLISEVAQEKSGIENLTAFLDIFHHRIVILFYQIWKKFFYEYQYINNGKDRVSTALLTLINGDKNLEEYSQSILGLINNFNKKNRNLIGLKNIITYILPETNNIMVQQFVPVKRKIFQPKLSIGIPFGQAALGNYIYDACSKIKIIITVDNYHLLQNLMHGKKHRIILHNIVKKYIGYELDIDLAINISSKLLPQATIKYNYPQELNSGLKIGNSKSDTFFSIFLGAL